MKRLIDKDATIELIEGNIHEIISESGRDLNEHTNRTLRRIAKTIEEMQTFEERKTGKWIIKRTKVSQVIFPHCSCCDWYSYNWVKHPFCPNCGAKMEGAEE